MIISLKHGYIYVRTRKTGSSTIEWLLKQHLGPDDIVVRESLECLRPLLKPGVEIPAADGLITHVPVSQVLPLVREDIWNSTFKFTSERHPYEKALSYAHYRLDRLRRAGQHDAAEHKMREFDDHLKRVVRGGNYASFRYYSVDGTPVVNDVIKLESFQSDLKRICDRFGIPVPEEMPRRRGKSRTDRRPAREVLSQEQRDIVYDFCRPEFEFLGYER